MAFDRLCLTILLAKTMSLYSSSVGCLSVTHFMSVTDSFTLSSSCQSTPPSIDLNDALSACFGLRWRIILFFFCLSISIAPAVNEGAITTSRKILSISAATVSSITLLVMATPPYAETGSQARADSQAVFKSGRDATPHALHNNACGVASRPDLKTAWESALACDPVSAYGGVAITNRVIDETVAAEMDKIFLEVVMAPSFTAGAIEILKQKKNRIILHRKSKHADSASFRSMLGGVLWQERDRVNESVTDMKCVTERHPTDEEYKDMVFANRIVRQSRSNAIVLAKGGQLCASGIGQTSRIDALRQAIDKARAFGLPLEGAVMASDAFFPFADSVSTAHEAGITAIIQPGGSVRDQESIDYCNKNNVSMVFTGIRHFKH